MDSQITHIAISLRIRVLHQKIEQHLPTSPVIVGKELAEQISQFSHENKLGYYPALEYFKDKDVEMDLLDAAENISIIVCDFIKEELQKYLSDDFTNIHFESLQNIAFTFPTIRFGSSNELHNLASHYSPNHVKVNIIVTVENEAIDSRSIEKSTRIKILHRLKGRFADLKINSIKLFEPEKNS